MSTALRIAHGAFGRVALLDMDWSLVRHAHPHCHVLLKVEGSDTQFVVGDTVYPLTYDTAVLVNGWQPHSYVHDPDRPRTVILALYIEPEWLMAFRPGWAASGAPGFFSHPSGKVSPRIRSLAMNDVLTGLANRMTLRAHVERCLGNPTTAVVFIDLNGFKPINDEHGRAVGDEILRRVASRLEASVRKGDVVARYGGDEFVIVAAIRDPEELRAVLSKAIVQADQRRRPQVIVLEIDRAEVPPYYRTPPQAG